MSKSFCFRPRTHVPTCPSTWLPPRASPLSQSPPRFLLQGFDALNTHNNAPNFTPEQDQPVKAALSMSTLTQLLVSFTHLAPRNAGTLLVSDQCCLAFPFAAASPRRRPDAGWVGVGRAAGSGRRFACGGGEAWRGRQIREAEALVLAACPACHQVATTVSATWSQSAAGVATTAAANPTVTANANPLFSDASD